MEPRTTQTRCSCLTPLESDATSHSLQEAEVNSAPHWLQPSSDPEVRVCWAGVSPTLPNRVEKAGMTDESEARRTNWRGLASTVGLLIWFLCWFKNEPRSTNERTVFWGSLVLVHGLAIRAARRRHGWIYFLPLGIFWILIVMRCQGASRTRNLPKMAPRMGS
jgi:hypothetical protein